MARTQWSIVVATLLVSCISFVFYVVSISTDSWIVANAILTDRLESDVNYGLFSGKLDRQQLASTLRFDLSVSCDFSEGACIYSCQRTGDDRQEELHRILNGELLQPCEQARAVNSRRAGAFGTSNASHILKTSNPGSEYIPAGLWLCTVLFLIVGIIFTAAAATFALLNLNYSPVEPIFNVFGLYVWNGVAATASLLSLALWGGLFEDYLRYNIAITDTLRQELTFTSSGRSHIGFSYYMLLVGCLLNVLNIGLLCVRSYISERQAVPPTLTITQNDAPLEFY